MNKKLLLPILCAAAWWLPPSCSVDTAPSEPPVRDGAGLTAAAAREFYETARPVRTRSGEATAGALTLGTFEPLWDAALPSESLNLEAVDVPVWGDCLYRLPVGRDSLGRELGLRIAHRLVVLRQKSSGNMCSYLIFYLPDSCYAAARPLQTAELCETLLSCAEKASFTGLALYTRTDGTPVAAQRYDEGMPGAGAFLFDGRCPARENLERLRRMIGSVELWKCGAAKTRGVGGINSIAPVIVYGQQPIRTIVIEVPPVPVVDEGVTEFTPLFPGFAGGPGGGADADGNSKFRGNENIRTKDPDVLELLDEFMLDCMGRTLIQNLNYTIEIENGEANFFNAETVFPKITLTQNPRKHDIHDVILMEELLHAYQYQVMGRDIYARQMNCEIEAKLGWYMYRQRIGQTDGLGNSVTKNMRDSFTLIIDAFHSETIYTDKGLDLMEACYTVVFSELCRIDSYRGLSFSDQVDIDYLLGLMKDC